VYKMTSILAKGLSRLGHAVPTVRNVFDTLTGKLGKEMTADRVLQAAWEQKMNLRKSAEDSVAISLDETTDKRDIVDLLECFSPEGAKRIDLEALIHETDDEFDGPHMRTSRFLQHSIFNSYHSETEMMRYIKRLESRDLSLTTSM